MINWMMGSEYPPDPIVDAIIFQLWEDTLKWMEENGLNPRYIEV